MNFLPYENFYIISPLKPGDIQAALEKVVAPNSSVKINWGRGGYISEGYFMGYSINGSFKLQQVLTYRNSFAPIIIGSTTSHQIGSRVNLEMKLLPFTKAFLAFCCLFLILFTASLLYNNFKDNHILPSSLMPVGMLIIAYLMTILGFKAESDNAKSYLLDLFAGEIE